MIDSQKNELSLFEVTKSKLSVMEYHMSREMDKIKDEQKQTIEELM